MHQAVLILQKAPLLWPVAAWVLGLALARTDFLNITLAAFVLIAAVILLLVFHRRGIAVLLVLGAAWGIVDLLFDAQRMVVDKSWIDQKVMVRAEVEKVDLTPTYMRLQLNHVFREDGSKLSGKAILYLHGGNKRLPVQAGQKIRAMVSWRLPRNHLNPGGFDYRAWCFDRHIALIGSVRGSLEVTDEAISWLESARQRIRRASSHAGDQAGVLRAVLLGDRSRVSEQANALFAATGTAHLLAISGMHVGMAAAWVFALIYWLLTRREEWIVFLPVRVVALLCGLSAAMAYATLADWPLPAMRAGFMLAAGVLAWLMASRCEPVNALLASLGLILLLDPAAIASLSLWLSFVATASILLWVERPSTSGFCLQSAILGLFRVSVLATLATLPIILSTFGRIPLFTLPANMLLVPLYGLIIMPLGLGAELATVLGLQALGGALMEYSGLAIALGLGFLEWLSQLPAGQLWSVKLPLWNGLLYMSLLLGAGWLLLQRKKVWAGLLITLLLAIYLTAALHERDVEVPTWVVWDAGQGAASTLLLPGKQVIIIDAPGRRGSRFNGGTTMASGLRSMGITHADVLILSHAQSDHLGGALSLMRHMNNIGQIWLPDVPAAHAHARAREIIAYADAHGIAVRWLAQGEEVAVGGVAARVLWPPRSYVSSNQNNTSLVLMLQLPDGERILLPGDIEAIAENALLEFGIEAVDAMLIPHHGSRTSSLPALVLALHPALAVAQTGYANHYGFPKDDVVERYRAVGADVRNTADGAVLVRWTGSKRGAEVVQWRGEVETRREIALQWMQSYLYSPLI